MPARKLLMVLCTAPLLVAVAARGDDKVVIRDIHSKSKRTYLLDQGAARDLRAGQVITYDVEERGSHVVITRWQISSWLTSSRVTRKKHLRTGSSSCCS